MYREDYLNQFRVSRILLSVLITGLLSLAVGCQSTIENGKVSHTEITSKIVAESPREVTTESKTVAPPEVSVVLKSLIMKDVNQADLLASVKPISVAAVNGKELNFESLEQEVVLLLGKPTSSTSLNGVTSYRYENENSDSGPYESAVYFIENKMSILTIGNKKIEGPKGIRCGDDMAKAIVLFASPAQLQELGIEKDTSVSDIHKRIAEINIFELNFEIDGLLKLNMSYSNDYTITKIHIWRSVEQTEPVQIVDADFDANVSEIVAKFGYPIAIDMQPPYAVILGYDDNFFYNFSKRITLLNATFNHPNSFSTKDDWSSEIGLRAGQKKSEVATNLKITLGDENHDYFYSKYNGEEYEVFLGFKGEELESYSIKMVDKPTFSTQKMQCKFFLPKFDPESIATPDDMYLSGLKFGSNREDVFKLLGAPENIISGFDDYTFNYQDCSFKSGFVAFQGVTDGRDLKTGHAYNYSISDKDVIGPRGLKVGDPIEHVLDVFPGNNAIDFKALKEPTIIYEEKPGSETNSATIYPDSEGGANNTGEIHINIIWYLGVNFSYENGVITEIGLTQMLD